MLGCSIFVFVVDIMLFVLWICLCVDSKVSINIRVSCEIIRILILKCCFLLSCNEIYLKKLLFDLIICCMNVCWLILIILNFLYVCFMIYSNEEDFKIIV